MRVVLWVIAAALLVQTAVYVVSVVSPPRLVVSQPSQVFGEVAVSQEAQDVYEQVARELEAGR